MTLHPMVDRPRASTPYYAPYILIGIALIYNPYDAVAATVNSPGSSRNVSPAVADEYAALRVAVPGETAVSMQ